MAHLQYMPGDPRLVDQLVYELKSKGIFDQFRKDCIADVDTRPAYQNLRQRVENSVSTFLSRQCWKPELNKNQLREKLRKHILDGNYLEQGVERIVDQVVNPKVASVFIPQVEDLVYNYLGVPRKKNNPETSDSKTTEDLLPTDLEAVSPGSVKSNDDKPGDVDQDLSEDKMDIDEEKSVTKEEEDKIVISEDSEQTKEEKSPTKMLSNNCVENVSIAHESIPLENIPAPDNSPPKIDKVDLEKIELPKEPYIHPNLSTSDVGPDEIPLPKDEYFKPLSLNSDDESSNDSSLRRNMSPLTPIRNYNNENSCDAQQAFENDSDSKSNDKREPSTFRFAIETKSPNSDDKEKKDDDQIKLSSQFNNQVNINAFNTPISYDDSSNSNNLQIDYESDANSKANTEKTQDIDQESHDKKDKKEERRSSHKSSHRSRDSHRHSSSKDKRSDSKHSTSRDSSRHDKKKDDSKSKSSSHKEREKSKDRSDKKDNRDSSKHKSSSHKSTSHRDSKSHRSSSSHKPSDKKPDEKRSSSSHRSSSDKSSSRSSKDKKDSKPSSHRDKDKKSSSKKPDDKDKKKDKKDTDDHYSLSGRGNHSRRSTDRDSNDGSSSSKGSQNPPSSRTEKKESKESSTKSSTPSSESTSPSDCKEVITTNANNSKNPKPIRVEEHLETPITSPPRLPFVPDITLKKPKFAANFEEAKRMMKMRKFLDEEQKRMNQEAALLLEFQANVRPSMSQVYSSIPGPELEFACVPGVVNKPTNTKTERNEVDQISEEALTDDETQSYNENKPFSQLMDEITQYSKASEMKKDSSIDKNDQTTSIVNEIGEGIVTCKIEDNVLENKEDIKINVEEKGLVDSQMVIEMDSKHLDTKIIVSKNENRENIKDESIEDIEKEIHNNVTVKNEVKLAEFFEVTIITEELSEAEDTVTDEIKLPAEAIIKTKSSKQLTKSENNQQKSKESMDSSLKYFTEQEKYDAEMKKLQYNKFLKTYIVNSTQTNKLYVINCNTYEENIIKEVSKQFGYCEIVNYYKNGHLKKPKANVIVKDVNLTSEISLPIEMDNYGSTNVFSPVKSESSFELSSDYDAKLEEMVNKTSRQQVMEIILGNIEAENMTVDYCSESDHFNLKRKLVESESLENNNMEVVSKMRKMSDSDQISSTTEEPVEVSNNNQITSTQRSKYLGRARRVGLPKPKRTNLPNSPSSDKSVENYEQNTPTTPNGKLKITRTKVQRYDKSDLYKPKLHYLSRRNNIS